MEQLTAFQWIEVVGWLASGFTVATYAMNTMLPLRIMAIGSTVCFLIYGLVLGLWPLVAMEVCLLPINTWRLWQLLSLRRPLKTAEGRAQDDFSVIRAYGKKRKVAVGDIVFERGDPVDQLYFLASGRILIEDLGIELEQGQIFGELAFFTDAATRSATARCVEAAELFELDEKQFMRLQFQDPSFGMGVMRTITRRMNENLVAARAAAAE